MLSGRKASVGGGGARIRRAPCLRAALLLVAMAPLPVAGCGGAGTPPGPAEAPRPLRVVFVGDSARGALDAEAAAALDWLESLADAAVRYVQLADLPTARPQPDEVVWWHTGRTPVLPAAALDEEVISAVRRHLAAGGGLLLSLFASPYVVPLGIETVAPNEVRFLPGGELARWSPEDDRILVGFQSEHGHPLLRRFWGGTYTATLQAQAEYPVAVYRGEAWPTRGRVIGVERRTIAVRPDRRVAVEYRPALTDSAAGHVLVLGEGLYFAAPDNHNRVQLERLTRDALALLAGQLPPPPPGVGVPSTGAPPPDAAAEANAGAVLPEILRAASAWRPRREAVVPWPLEPSPPAPATRPSPALLESLSAARSGLSLQAPADPDVAFDAYAPRCLLTGRQNGLLEEAWVYPYRVLRSLRFGWAPAGGSPVWLDELDEAEIVARPEGTTFRYRLQGRPVAMHVAVSRRFPGLSVLLEDRQAPAGRWVARWIPDHAPMWPRHRDALGPLLLGWDAGARAVAWSDAEHRLTVYAGFGRPDDAVRLSAAPPEGGPPSPALEPDGSVRLESPTSAGTPWVVFALSAALAGEGDPLEGFHALLADPLAVWTENANFYRAFLQDTVDLSTPDPTFNEAFRWAKVGLEAFRVRTPGMGTGLAAGYATSADPARDAWARDNDFLQRPGYAWYFGRDAVWTAFAADAYGGTDLASEALRLLARYQDVDGKILHELSPSWALHYDAADSTPLFLLGLERHVRTTGDRELLRLLWPTVRRAFAFLESTDADGDGLIDNAGVGHGWIEGGRFYGAHTTLYLAGLWVAALRAVEQMAGWIADDELAARARERLPTAEAALEGFWDEGRRTWHYGKRRDGSYMPLETIMPLVPMWFGVLRESRVGPLLERVAGGDVTADWGVRMTARSNPAYDPGGYHAGMAWPLFSGWAALAAHRYHRPWSGWIPLVANVRLHRFDNLGHLPEALHGERFASVGVTSHQAWSEAMVILPTIEGLMGIRVDAIAGTLRFHPHLPGGWQRVSLAPLRLGDGAFRLTVERGREASRMSVERLSGTRPVRLELSMPFPRAVLANLDRDATRGIAIREGETIVDHATEKEVLVRGTLSGDSAVVTFRHGAFPQVVPPLPELVPGGASSGLRIVDTAFRERALRVRLEGVPGKRYRLRLATPWPVARVRGLRAVRVVARGPELAVLEFNLPGPASSYQRAELTVEFAR